MSKEDLALAAVPRFVAIGLQRQLGRELLARGLKWVVNARLPQPAMPASGRFLPSASDAFGQKPFGIPLWVALPRTGHNSCPQFSNVSGVELSL